MAADKSNLNADDDVLDVASQLQAKKQPFALATVIETEGSTSARTSAKAIFDAEGGVVLGWVGGGCAQSTVAHAALESLRTSASQIVELDLNDEVLGTGAFEEIDVDTVRSVLDEVAKLSEGVLAESFADADRNPPVFDPQTHSAPIPESFKKSYAAWMDSEFWRMGTLNELGGTMAPSTVNWAIGELVLGANPALWMYGAGPMFAGVVHRNGTDRDKQIAQFMVDKQWGATMVLTEPDAGSDVGAGRTKAVQNDDGTWNITGVKRFITSATNDMTENVIHLVLARPEGIDGVGGPIE